MSNRRSESFIPDTEEQKAFVNTVFARKGEDDDDTEEFSVSEMDPAEAQSCRLRQLRQQQQTTEDSDCEGQDEPPALPPYSSELSRIHAAYAPQQSDDDSHSESSQEPRSLSDPPPVLLEGRTLVLSGRSSYSLVHHLGVITYYVETKQLQYVTEVWAEDFGVCVAVLLKAYWDQLTHCDSLGREPDADLVSKLLLDPCLAMLVSHPVHDYLASMHYHFNLGTAGAQLYWWEEDTLPRLHLCHHVPHKDQWQASVQKLPLMFRWTDRHLQGSLVCEALKCMFAQAQNAADSPRTPGTGCDESNTLWDALYGSILMKAGSSAKARGQVQRIYVSYAGHAMLPPINQSSLTEVVTGNMHTPWEFCSVVWRATTSNVGIAADVTLYSVFSGRYQHIVGKKKLVGQQMQSEDKFNAYRKAVSVYYTQARVEPARDALILQHMLNWGFMVAWSTDALLRDHIKQFKEEVKEATRSKPLFLPEHFYLTAQPLIDPVSLGTLQPAEERKAATHTPCKWVFNLLGNRKK